MGTIQIAVPTECSQEAHTQLQGPTIFHPSPWVGGSHSASSLTLSVFY